MSDELKRKAPFIEFDDLEILSSSSSSENARLQTLLQLYKIKKALPLTPEITLQRRLIERRIYEILFDIAPPEAFNSSLHIVNTALGTTFSSIEDVFLDARSMDAALLADIEYDPEQDHVHALTAYSSEVSRVVRKRHKQTDEEDGTALPRNGFAMYTAQMYPSVRAQFPESSQRELMERLSGMWSALQAAEKDALRKQGVAAAAKQKPSATAASIQKHAELVRVKSKIFAEAAAQEKPFSCSQCGKRFKSEGGIKYHAAHVCVTSSPPPSSGFVISELSLTAASEDPEPPQRRPSVVVPSVEPVVVAPDETPLTHSYSYSEEFDFISGLTTSGDEDEIEHIFI